MLLLRGARLGVAQLVREVGIGLCHRKGALEELRLPIVGGVASLNGGGAKGDLVEDINLREVAPVPCMYLWLVQSIHLLQALAIHDAPPGPLALRAWQRRSQRVHKDHGLHVLVH